jgi:Cu/Zn superoxide dismutase
MEGPVTKARIMAAAVVFCAAGMLAAAQAPQAPPAPAAPQAPAGGQGRGAGRGGGGAAGAPAAPAGPARGITINANPVQKAHADITGTGITGTADFVEYAQANGTIMQVVVTVTGLPPGLHGMHIHAVGKCEAPAFTTAGGHFDPGPAGNMDADLNHPFHSGDLPNLSAGADGRATATSYTTRFGLGGPLSLFDADGSAIIIHANPDTFSTGTQGQGVAGGPRLACGVINKT